MADITTGQDVDLISAIPTGDNVIGRVKITDGTTVATVRELGTNDALNIAICDGSGNQITSFSGPTEYTEDAAAAADPVGAVQVLVRADTPAAVTGTDGDNIARRGTNYGAAYTQIVTSAGAFVDTFGGGSQYTEGDTDATITGTATMMEVAANVLQPIQGTVADGLLVNLGSNNDVTVTGNIAHDSPDSGSFPIKIGGKGLSTVPVAVTTGDRVDAWFDTQGALITRTIGSGTPHDSADNVVNEYPIKIGGRAYSTTPTPVADQDRTDAWFDLYGVQVVRLAGSSGAVVLVNSPNADGVGDTITTINTKAHGYTYNGSTFDRVRSAVNATNSTGTGIQAVGLTAQFDDASPTSITENQFGNVRISANRNLYGTIRDAAGNERGANVNASNELLVAVSSIPSHAVTNAGTFLVQAAGDVAHGTTDSGNVVKTGGVAVSGSASPTSVASGDRTRSIYNQHGVPYAIGGHPNLITREYDFGTAAQTDINLAAAAVAADERIYVTRFEATCDNANTVNVSVRAGFGAANVPAASATGVSGMIASHPGIAPGSGIVSGSGAGILAVGGAGEEPRLTTSAATSGNLHVLISYFLIDETP